MEAAHDVLGARLDHQPDHVHAALDRLARVGEGRRVRAAAAIEAVAEQVRVLLLAEPRGFVAELEHVGGERQATCAEAAGGATRWGSGSWGRRCDERGWGGGGNAASQGQGPGVRVW